MLIGSKMYVYCLAIISIVMWVIHTVMALSNTTSFELGKGAEHLEYLRGMRECDLPFGKGLFANLKLFCCVRDAFSYALLLLLGRSRGKVGNISRWSPILWRVPDRIVRDSEDWWEHPW